MTNVNAIKNAIKLLFKIRFSCKIEMFVSILSAKQTNIGSISQ